MYSKHHALLSLVVSVLLVWVLQPVVVSGRPIPAWVVVAYGTAVGVLIDLDHFLIARYKTGTWDAVRVCLRSPAVVVADQGAIFEAGDVGVLSRLLSHLVIVGLFGTVLAVVSLSLAVVTVGVWYVHILSDIVWDIHRLDRFEDASRAELLDEMR